MNNARLSDQPVEQARGRLIEVVHRIHAVVPESDLPARQLVQIRRDLAYLVAESRRNVFRPVVAEVLCTAVPDAVSHGQPELATKAVIALGGLG